MPYKQPYLLSAAGVTVSLSHEGMLGQARNLSFYAGSAVAYGLDKEEALKMITSNTAKALGIDARVGTIEVGKYATLFISEGDVMNPLQQSGLRLYQRQVSHFTQQATGDVREVFKKIRTN